MQKLTVRRNNEQLYETVITSIVRKVVWWEMEVDIFNTEVKIVPVLVVELKVGCTYNKNKILMGPFFGHLVVWRA